MKRMTLLTALALGFSLITMTAAIAGPGPDAGEANQAGEMVMTRTTTQTQLHEKGGECRASDPESERVPERDQIRDKDQTRTNAPGKDQPQPREQLQIQNREQVSECSDDAPGIDCEMPREEAREQVRDRFMKRMAVMIGVDTDDAEYRHMFQRVWTHVFGPLHVFFF